MKNIRIILHIDMNAFYASCAAIKEPYLKNKVFAVGGPAGTTQRGVLSTASYNARKLGIHSGMVVKEALTIYPKLVIVPTDFNLYKEKSNTFMAVLKSYSNLIFAGSIDEAYLDITEASNFTHPEVIAKTIQDKLYYEHQLPSSIGIAPTLFLAKMASDYKKPMGITVLRKRDVAKMLYPLAVKDIYGIGKKTSERLKQFNINTIADFMNPDHQSQILKVLSPRHYQEVKDDLLGNSTNIVNPDKYAIARSISNETTLNTDINSYELLLEELNNQFERSFKRLIKHQLLTRTISIKIKYSDFRVVSRSLSFFDYTIDKEMLKSELENLFSELYAGENVRLIGAGFSNLIQVADYELNYDLFNYQKILDK